jgi:hypothetical protein
VALALLTIKGLNEGRGPTEGSENGKEVMTTPATKPTYNKGSPQEMLGTHLGETLGQVASSSLF